MSNEKRFGETIRDITARMRKRVKKLPIKEAAALVVTLGKALADGELSGAEWDVLVEKFEALRAALERAEVIREQ